MEITELITDSAGNSRFESEPILMESSSEMGFYSEIKSNVKEFYFQTVPSNHSWDSLTVNEDIYIIVIVMNGLLELVDSTGEKKDFGPGQVILLKDHSGKGHKLVTLTIVFPPWLFI